MTSAYTNSMSDADKRKTELPPGALDLMTAMKEHPFVAASWIVEIIGTTAAQVLIAALENEIDAAEAAEAQNKPD